MTCKYIKNEAPANNSLQVNIPISNSQKAFEAMSFPAKATPIWKKYIKKSVAQRPKSFSRMKCLPIETRDGSLKTAVYIATIQAIEQDKIGLIAKRARVMGVKCGENAKQPTNPFRVMFAVLCTVKTYEISIGNRCRWAIQLHYSYLHDVAPENLLGFLYQEGSHELIAMHYKKLIAGH